MSEKRENVKFEEAIEIAGYGKFNMFIIFLSGMTVCTSMLACLDVSFLLPSAECDFQLTSDDKGLLGSSYFVGVLCASHMSGFLADTLGRRYMLLRGLTLTVIVYILGALAPNFWTFLVLKVICGITSAPCLIAAFPFLGEYVPPKKRSHAILVMSSMGSLGLLYASFIGWATLQNSWKVDLIFITFTPWRLFYMLCSLPGLLCAILFFFTPESPKFLLTRGKKGDTMKILQKVHSINSGTLPQSYPVQSVSIDINEKAAPERQKGVAGVLTQFKNQTLPLFQHPYLRNLLVCILMYFLCLFCVNALFLWLPEIVNRVFAYHETHEGDGLYRLCHMMSEYSTAAESINVTDRLCETTVNSAMFLPNVLLALAQPIAMFLASLIVPYMDKRYFIMALYILTSGISYLLIEVTDVSFMIILLGGIPLLLGTCFNVISCIIVEVFPTYIRAMAVSLTIICGRIGSIVGSYLFSRMIDSYCNLLFQCLAILLACCSVIPLAFKLKLKNAQEQRNEDSPPSNGKV